MWNSQYPSWSQLPPPPVTCSADKDSLDWDHGSRNTCWNEFLFGVWGTRLHKSGKLAGSLATRNFADHFPFCVVLLPWNYSAALRKYRVIQLPLAFMFCSFWSFSFCNFDMWTLVNVVQNSAARLSGPKESRFQKTCRRCLPQSLTVFQHLLLLWWVLPHPRVDSSVGKPTS